MGTALALVEWAQAATPEPSPTESPATGSGSGWSSGDVRAALIALVGTGFLVLANIGISLFNGWRETRRHRESLTAQKDESELTNARERIRLLTERFGRAADQIGSDEPVVRLAGVYAMAALADEWDDDQAQRQKCVDVLCGYLRLPPREQGEELQTGEEQVRVALVDTIAEHCRHEAPVSWSGLAFDFVGAQFLGPARFGQAQFHGPASFQDAQFHGEASFKETQFHGAASFDSAKFHSLARFTRAQFHDDASFREAQFHGYAFFRKAQFHGDGWFSDVQFHLDALFPKAQFHGDALFGEARFFGLAYFRGAHFHGDAFFWKAEVRRGIDLSQIQVAEQGQPEFVPPHGTPTANWPGQIEANWDGTNE